MEQFLTGSGTFCLYPNQELVPHNPEETTYYYQNNPGLDYNIQNQEFLRRFQTTVSCHQNILGEHHINYINYIIRSPEALQTIQLESSKFDLEAFSRVPQNYVALELSRIQQHDLWGGGIQKFLNDLNQAIIHDNTTLDDIKKSGLFFINNSALLHDAAIKGNIIDVIHLIKLGADINVQDGQGANAINRAVRALLEYYRSWQETFKTIRLIKETYSEYVECTLSRPNTDFSKIDEQLTIFINGLINCFNKFYFSHKIPSHLQIEQSLQVIRYLYMKQADPNMADSFGHSALDNLRFALIIDLNTRQPITIDSVTGRSSEDRSEIANLYRELISGSSQYSADALSMTKSLHDAVTEGNMIAVISLIESGKNVNEKKLGQTALSAAALKLRDQNNSWKNTGIEMKRMINTYQTGIQNILQSLEDIKERSNKLIQQSMEFIDKIDSFYARILPLSLQIEQSLQMIKYLCIEKATPNTADAFGHSALGYLFSAVVDSHAARLSDQYDAELEKLYSTLESRNSQPIAAPLTGDFRPLYY